MVRQSFFHDDSRNFVDVGGGVTGVRGFHSSFRLAQDGLSLNMGNILNLFLLVFRFILVFVCYIPFITNMASFISFADVSTTMILKPGPVIDFLIANQNVREPRYIDWAKVHN